MNSSWTCSKKENNLDWRPWIRVCSSVLSLKNNGTIRSLSCQPSISVIVTGDRVRKYWHILGILNHLSRKSTPASDDQCSSNACDRGHIPIPIGWMTDGGSSSVYYESIKREPKIRGIYECRCDERLQTKTREFTRLTYTVDPKTHYQAW